MRRIASGLDEHPSGFELALTDTARALGLGHMGGRNSPFVRALARLCQFDLAQARDGRTLAVRRNVPPLNRRQVLRLSEPLQAAHERWQREQLATPAHEQSRRRARRLALSLLQLGQDADATERQLVRWRFHPALCRDAANWAMAQHREAMAAAQQR